MPEKKIIPHYEVAIAAHQVADQIASQFPKTTCLKLYGWPRGGIPAAYMVYAFLVGFGRSTVIVENPVEANIIIDDLIDSGRTKYKVTIDYPDAVFYTLFEKQKEDGWFVFPWENSADFDTSGIDIITRLIQYIGEDAARGGLQETPKRVLKAWRDMTVGYNQKPEEMLKVFDDGAQGVDEMVTVQNIPVWSLCEHHMLPFFGRATISYIPNQKIVGLSKLSRVVNAFARRLQVQERLTNQIADLIDSELKPLGVGVHLRCRHLCMEARGVCTHDSNTATTALRGVIKEEPAARSEFLNLTNGGK